MKRRRKIKRRSQRSFIRSRSCLARPALNWTLSVETATYPTWVVTKSQSSVNTTSRFIICFPFQYNLKPCYLYLWLRGTVLSGLPPYPRSHPLYHVMSILIILTLRSTLHLFMLNDIIYQPFTRFIRGSRHSWTPSVRRGDSIQKER